MTPLVFISGILLGTAFAIFFGLAVVALIMAWLGVDTPRVSAEIRPLLTYSAVFLVLTLSSSLGFIGMLKNHRWRWVGQGAMWFCWVFAVFWLIDRL